MRRIAPCATTQYWHWLAPRGRHDDHLALGLGEAAGLLHQRVVVGEERAELVRPVRQREEHVGDEARLLLHREDARADVVGQASSSGTGKRLMGSVMAEFPAWAATCGRPRP